MTSTMKKIKLENKKESACVVPEASLRRVDLSWDLNGKRGKVMWKYQEIAFQAEGIASPKALGWVYAMCPSLYHQSMSVSCQIFSRQHFFNRWPCSPGWNMDIFLIQKMSTWLKKWMWYKEILRVQNPNRVGKYKCCFLDTQTAFIEPPLNPLGQLTIATIHVIIVGA